MLLVACGGAQGGDDDAGPDGGVDANTARVRVIASGLGNSSATVFFLGADGRELATVTPDRDGFASGPMEANGYLVVGDTRPSSGTLLEVITDVQPGDDLLAGDPINADDGLPAAEWIEVDAPFDPEGSPQDLVGVSSCGTLWMHPTEGQPGRADTTLTRRCTGTVTATLVSRDNDGLPLRFTTVTGTVTGTTLTLTGPAYAVAPDVTYQLTGIPEAATTNGVDLSLGYDSQAFGGHARDLVVTDGTATASLAWPLLAQPYRERIHLSTPTPNINYYLSRWSPAAAGASQTLDVAAMMPPTVSNAAWDPATHAVTWTESGGALTPAFVATRLIFGEMQDQVQILARAPYTAGKIQLPPLPMYNGQDPNPPAGTKPYLYVTASPVPWSAFKRDIRHTLESGESGVAAFEVVL
jgi:hypothetical protein